MGVHYKAGDLVLWDGRTVHCNSPAVEGENEGEDDAKRETEEATPQRWDLTRMVVYICLGPRAKAKNEILKKRQEIAFALNVTSTHWPQFFRYRLGAGCVDRKGFELNEKQKRLVGYPRAWYEEALWQAKYEYRLGFGDLWVFASFLGALG